MLKNKLDKNVKEKDNDEQKYKQKLEKRQRKLEEPNKTFGDLLELKRAVSLTRLNRINASNRLLQTESFLQAINIYYSCFSALLAILSLISKQKELAVWSTIVAIILAISIVYLNAQKFGNRSQELKTNYIALHALLFEIEKAIADNEDKNIDALTDKYCKLLQTSENHTDLDFLRQRIQSNLTLSNKDKAKYFLYISWNYLLKLMAISFPILLIIRLVLIGAFTGLL